jgi:acyl carrier protein|tara:strand:+ start:363 stop:575 length:213 start_codon:yes stop_codon:yes gene_type:complete
MKTVEQIIADHLDIEVEDVTDEKDLIEDLGADSLHTVELIMEFEQNFDIEIPDGDADELRTVGQIKEYLA